MEYGAEKQCEEKAAKFQDKINHLSMGPLAKQLGCTLGESATGGDWGGDCRTRTFCTEQNSIRECDLALCVVAWSIFSFFPLQRIYHTAQQQSSVNPLR